ncbi:hypothetical protein [Mucilaginibacter segetis]|uniref:Uncharacterized protein n=1 Tax=Mucilaginibacter segetis TaxID=2793071 RepID=A0A934PW57_9SPHI|nr:hypothetical protein [Mucilaginibacter segetis]MBK0380186.1 hypothetical protein [Mucilaginibacter segetis]
MKKNAYQIICPWILLFCFIAGQYMVYAHQHNIIKNSSSLHDLKSSTQQTVKEKCQLCDIMHHSNMDVVTHSGYTITLITSDHTFKSPEYEFTSIALILAAGRAPPLVS